MSNHQKTISDTFTNIQNNFNIWKTILNNTNIISDPIIQHKNNELNDLLEELDNLLENNISQLQKGTLEITPIDQRIKNTLDFFLPRMIIFYLSSSEDHLE